MEPNIHDTSKPRGGRSRKLSAKGVQSRIAHMADKFNLDTQRIRYGLILELKALAEMAQQKAIDTHPASIESKQSWVRLAAYISQVINSISKTYDEAQITADLERLEKMVKELLREKTPTLKSHDEIP